MDPPTIGKDPGGCECYIPKKKRYCKFPPTDGEKFCVQHLPRDEHGQVIVASDSYGSARVVFPNG